MSRFILLIAEVPHNKADEVSQAANEAGCAGGTVLIGRKISSNRFALAIGVGSNTIDVLYLLTEEEKKDAICNAVKQLAEKEKFNSGAIYALSAEGLLKTGNFIQGEEKMNAENTHELITVILNRGYADDAMQAARKAGAGGGTVVNARGTAREDDAKFFGMHIVPEKEMLMIVVESEKKAAVIDAIKNLPCLSEPGSGIAFCAGVSDFTLIGKKNA